MNCSASEPNADCEAMDLASGVDCLALALELANSAMAKNRIERLLCQQMAMMHSLGATMASRAKAEADNIKSDWMRRNTAQFQAACVEANRLNNASARAFSSFQDAALALQRLRTAGKQAVKVIHQQVQVNNGGKAVVAGTLRNGKKTGGQTAGGRGRNEQPSLYARLAQWPPVRGRGCSLSGPLQAFQAAVQGPGNAREACLPDCMAAREAARWASGMVPIDMAAKRKWRWPSVAIWPEVALNYRRLCEQ